MVEIADTKMASPNGLTTFFVRKRPENSEKKGGKSLHARKNRALRKRILDLAASDTEYEYISVSDR